jgi:hypothetical protein
MRPPIPLSDWISFRGSASAPTPSPLYPSLRRGRVGGALSATGRWRVGDVRPCASPLLCGPTVSFPGFQRYQALLVRGNHGDIVLFRKRFAPALPAVQRGRVPNSQSQERLRVGIYNENIVLLACFRSLSGRVSQMVQSLAHALHPGHGCNLVSAL